MRERSAVGMIRVAATCLLVGALAACGQKPGVHQVAVDAPGEGAATAAPGQPTIGSDSPTDAAGVPAAGPTGQPGSAVDGNQPAQSGGAPVAQPGSPDEPAQFRVSGTDRTGVTDTTITLAAHAPVTGAAPLPTTVFEQSSDLYWRWIRDVKGQDVLGREIEIVFQDDRYTPSTARQVCRQLMQVGFLLSGVGADGIAACAPLAAQQRVPYLAFGADEGALTGNQWYFSTSATYPRQGDLFAQYVRANMPGRKAGGLAIDTVNWDASVDAWEAGLQREGVPFAETLRHPREGTDWYAPYARELDAEGVEIVLALTSPLHLIRFAQVARDQGFDFHILHQAPGGLNAVLDNGCPALSNATAFGIWPSLDVIESIDPEFVQAVDRYNISSENLDLSLALWGANKFAHMMFVEYERRYGTDLTREDFRAMVETMTVSNGVFPDQTFTPDNHFGVRAGVHVLKADCTRAMWADGGTFKRSF